MILSRPAHLLSRFSAPLLSGLMILALLASMGIAPVIALAGVCAKPCCSHATHHAPTVASEGDGCCETEAPRAPLEHSEHNDEDAPSSGCSLEWCCDAGPQGVVLQTLPKTPLCASLCDGADSVCLPVMPVRESAGGWHTHGREAGWPPPTRRHLLNCLLLI